MQYSIITPVHRPGLKFLRHAYDSLKAQTVEDWQWIVNINGGVNLSEIGLLIPKDPRIKFISCDEKNPGVGKLKKMCVDAMDGSIIVEFDCDDLLMPNALEEIGKAFEDEKTMMAYSNDAQFNKDWVSTKYPEAFGWKYREFTYQGHVLNEAIAWPPSPHSFRRIWWAPDHARAWRRIAYESVGGHNPELKTGDDHDLSCRFYTEYGAAGIKHIDKCLYLYREHEKNTTKLQNAEIQIQSNRNYLNHIQNMTDKWADTLGLSKLDLGGRFNARKGFTTVDLLDADIITDLNKPWDQILDNSVGVLRASHILEHLEDPIHFFNEAYRVMSPGAFMFLEFPSVCGFETLPDGRIITTVGQGAYRDFTHRQLLCAQNIWYVTNEQYAKFIRPAYKGRFQLSRLETYNWPDGTPVVAAELIALKHPYTDRHAGEVLWDLTPAKESDSNPLKEPTVLPPVVDIPS